TYDPGTDTYYPRGGGSSGHTGDEGFPGSRRTGNNGFFYGDDDSEWEEHTLGFRCIFTVNGVLTPSTPATPGHTYRITWTADGGSPFYDDYSNINRTTNAKVM